MNVLPQISQEAQALPGHVSVLSRFSFKNARRGALIYGLFAGFMVALQGLAFAASYTTDLARAQFATLVAGNPALGVLYGEVRNVESPAGYMVYRSAVFLSFIGALWGLAVATRLLRGQEEDGRSELLLTGRASLVGLLRSTLFGLASSFLLALALTEVILAGLGHSPKINVSISASLFLGLVLFTPALIFMAVGALTSQLAATRRRAMIYGIVPLGGLFILRSVGNVVSSLRWFKNFTPFGWVDNMHAVTGSNAIWLLPAGVVTAILIVVAFYFASNRDLNESIVADKEIARPRFLLLQNPLTLGFRLSRSSVLGWLLGTAAIAGVITGVSKTAADALADSPSLSKAIGTITGGGSNTLGTMFVSMGGIFVALLLMAFVASGIGKIREDEAKGYLDNFLTGSISRVRWLVERIFLLVFMSAVICGLVNCLSWLIAWKVGITVSAGTLIGGGFNYLGPVFVMLGMGALLIGLRPRIASSALYAWIAWSFIVEMIGSVVTLNHYIIDTSLVRHVSLVPGTAANWDVFAVLSAIGVATLTTGLLLFARRDIVPE